MSVMIAELAHEIMHRTDKMDVQVYVEGPCGLIFDFFWGGERDSPLIANDQNLIRDDDLSTREK